MRVYHFLLGCFRKLIPIRFLTYYVLECFTFIFIFVFHVIDNSFQSTCTRGIRAYNRDAIQFFIHTEKILNGCQLKYAEKNTHDKLIASSNCMDNRENKSEGFAFTTVSINQ